MVKRNTEGQIVREEYYKDEWYEKKYDKQGNCTSYKDHEGNWAKWKYDDNGNVVMREDSDGYRELTTYDEEGNISSRTSTKGIPEKIAARGFFTIFFYGSWGGGYKVFRSQAEVLRHFTMSTWSEINSWESLREYVIPLNVLDLFFTKNETLV